jgi:hypothetical protein
MKMKQNNRSGTAWPLLKRLLPKLLQRGRPRKRKLQRRAKIKEYITNKAPAIHKKTKESSTRRSSTFYA